MSELSDEYRDESTNPLPPYDTGSSCLACVLVSEQLDDIETELPLHSFHKVLAPLAWPVSL